MKKAKLKTKSDLPEDLVEGEVKEIERKEEKIFYRLKLFLEQVFEDPPQEYLEREFVVPKSAEFLEYDHDKEEAFKINPAEIKVGDWLLLYLEETAKEIVEQESLKVLKVMKDTKSLDEETSNDSEEGD